MDEQSAFSTPSHGFNKSADPLANEPAVGSIRDLWSYERTLEAEGLTPIAGVDEAGRGPLAGPVVAACAIIPFHFCLDGINDSKQLTAKQREQSYERLIASETLYAIGIVDSDEIDRINILKATHIAMHRAVTAMTVTPLALLIDGLPVPTMSSCRHVALVGGDALSASIAAASILAKVTRDRLMCEYAAIFPQYGFDQHKGYGSAHHLKALRKHGPCPIHRRSFSPISTMVRPSLL